ncbi:MAG: 16S rRNA (uracil(1498)-N(3))-methyltransferase [Paludibacteraceae bacterium]|nr:16S rRNA (uracil(1498)-N(3))-methyltransferase [Paludibacteraceae bacterium]
MYLFYTPDIDHSHCLSEEESSHCVRVLRYATGDSILLTDGRGTTYTARITTAHPKHCEFEILKAEKQAKNHAFHLHITVAPTKNAERIEWMVEKCTEIGADEFTLLCCRYSERKQMRIDRLEKIILSAAKQSLTRYLPVIHEMTDFDAFIRSQQENDARMKAQNAAFIPPQRFVAHCYEADKRLLRDSIERGRDVVVLIGPEGDFSEQEIETALRSGFQPVSLGNSRLRTETAAVVACHTAILLNE